MLHSQTGTPINIIEAMNAQSSVGITDDPSVLLLDVCDQINNQRRPDRGNLTPLELLQLNAAERLQVNALHKERTFVPEVFGGIKGRQLLSRT